MAIHPELELAYIRYVKSSGRAAEANELAAQLVMTDRADSAAAAAAIELIDGSFPVLERLCREVAGTPRYVAARALGAALGKLRWLPPLRPILEAQPFEAANAAIHGAVVAMISRAEWRDADRILETLVPAARALNAGTASGAGAEPTRATQMRDEQARVAKARRFRHGAMGEVAAALAACKATDSARELVDEILARAPERDADDRVCAFAAAAPALQLLGEAAQARDLIQRAYDLFESEWGENVDGYGDPFLDTAAHADAHTRHLATWEHGQLWTPEPPVANVFQNPYKGFGVERRQQEKLNNEVVYLARYAGIGTRFATGKLAAALDVIDAARTTHPAHVPHLVRLLVETASTIDVESLARLGAWLAAVADDDVAVGRIAAALPRLTHADSSAWGDTRYTDVALRLARRVPHPAARTTPLLAIACALGGRRKTRDQAAALAEEVLALVNDHSKGGVLAEVTVAARRLLADLAVPRAETREIIYEGSTAYSLADHLMMLVYLFGNGLEEDTRFTANTADSILTARGLIMGTGSCRRVADMPEHPLYQPGDECYRQGDYAYAFLGTTPAPR
ncbi:MAG TPA: hypothetical protein VM261_30610 [Kofleriaceae bacterium]|nr:hypothetical protein [Kofleriaceae bacterium]